MSNVVTRFAPSPTGLLHIGAARTALFSWLYARKHQGKFRLRIEDTDRQRSTPEATTQILESLKWLGLHYDDEVVHQSKRFDIYQERAQKLIDTEHAYYCNCSRQRLEHIRAKQMAEGIKPRYDGFCRNKQIQPSANAEAVVRFKNPTDGEVSVADMVQGRVVYANSELDDLIIIRSDQSPTYNFAVVVDEIDMGITHVIRGDDHLNNTPRQINMFRAFGYKLPRFGHIPLILSPHGKKLSKRDNVEGVLELREAGYLPEAVINYLARLGWSFKDQEFFNVDELIKLFDVRNIGRSPSSLNPKKMEWINHQHLMKLSPKKAANLAESVFLSRGIQCKSPSLEKVFEVQKTRSKTLVEFVDKSKYFYEAVDEYEVKAANKFLTLEILEPLQNLRNELKKVEIWEKKNIHLVFKNILNKYGVKFGALAQPVRVALTGGTVSPGIDVTMELIGRKNVLRRLAAAIVWIESRKGKKKE